MTISPAQKADNPSDRQIACDASASGGCIATTTYQAGKVAVLGFEGQQTTLLLQKFTKLMGMVLQCERLAIATKIDKPVSQEGIVTPNFAYWMRFHQQIVE